MVVRARLVICEKIANAEAVRCRLLVPLITTPVVTRVMISSP